MTLKSKLCGFSDLNSLTYTINHPYSPSIIGFIVNFPKSKRYIENEKLKKLLDVDKKKTQLNEIDKNEIKNRLIKQKKKYYIPIKNNQYYKLCIILIYL